MSSRAWLAAKRRQLVLSQRSVFFPLFDPVLHVAATVVHLDYLPGRQPGIGHDEPDPWEEFPNVPFDLRYHPMLPVPGLGLVPEINQPDLNPTFRRPPHGTGQVRLEQPVQDPIGRESNEIRDSFIFAILVHLRVGKRRIAPKPEKDESGSIPFHDRLEQVKDSIGRVNVPKSQLRWQAVPIAGEYENRVKAVLPEMTVEHYVLLLAVSRIFRGIRVQNQPLLLLSPHESVIRPHQAIFELTQSGFGPQDLVLKPR